MASPVHDPELLDVLETITPWTLERAVWRVTWATRDPRTGGTGGGRWHPPDDFEALYTSFEEDGAAAEVYYHLSKAPIISSSHVQVHRLAATLNRTLVIDDPAILERLGITPGLLLRGDHARSRQVGSAARFLDLEGIVVPSARWPCSNLVLFPDRFSGDSLLRIEETRDLNWPAWRERGREGRP